MNLWAVVQSTFLVFLWQIQPLERARQADAILLGAVGGPKWDKLDRSIRPEKGLLKIRSQLGLYANLRPALLYPQLVDASSLKPEVVSGLDILIVRVSWLVEFTSRATGHSRVRKRRARGL